MKKIERIEIEKVAMKKAPHDSQEDPAYPNHTDTDIFVKGFAEGFEYLMNIAKKSDLHYSLTAIAHKEFKEEKAKR